MVNTTNNEKKAKANLVKRFIYSAFGLTVISGVVAVMGAPTKWS
ncbi:MAG TPA: hypothetical protein VL984_12025 [Acidimicrobiales bacterium]|nr:hypothetical protein [Acidimicrobiales bacterium]